MAASEWVSIKVPRAAYDEAMRLKRALASRGTKLLPAALRPSAAFTIGHVFVVGVRVISKAIRPRLGASRRERHG